MTGMIVGRKKKVNNIDAR